ncbi:MAG: alpha/beta hydrolase [Alphaproteobacteria bacterium]|nr:alpha/beta hydrolase [Alphaproteobacteria bacterium]MCB9695860.1 alpha/beta hydrolase [Alphaproteobacteria bacterium]
MWSKLAAPMFAMLAACGPRYAQLGPLPAEQIWSPLPVQHIEVDGVDVAWVDSGGNGKPLVMVHGLSSYLSFWEYQIPYFAQQGYRVIALDLPGYGQSGRPDAPMTPPWYADLVADFMDGIGVPDAVVMGHSMGGQISLTLALEHPEKVDALVLSAPAGIERFSKGSAQFLEGYWSESRALETTEEELRYTFTRVVFNRVDPGVERLLEERVRMQHTPEFRGTSVAVARSIRGMLQYPVVDRLGEINVPTLVIYGSDDRMIPNPILNGGRTSTIARQAQQAIPGSQIVMVPKAGHTVHHDDPEAFNTAVEAFLTRVAGRARG